MRLLLIACLLCASSCGPGAIRRHFERARAKIGPRTLAVTKAGATVR